MGKTNKQANKQKLNKKKTIQSTLKYKKRYYTHDPIDVRSYTVAKKETD